MTHGVRLYLVGSLVLVSLAGCGRGFFTAEREPWRAEAEKTCLKSGAVKEFVDLVRIDPISGPGICGAEFPLKVTALGENNSALSFADDRRPPGSVGSPPSWPISQTSSQMPASMYPYPQGARGSSYPVTSRNPIPLNASGTSPSYPSAPPQLGPASGSPITAFGPVTLKPTATLACPIVSALDQWLADSVQPAAMRWFGAQVVEIKQISAYSCRGMNGDPSAHVSEHAFGNALDIAAFTLANDRRISVKDGWNGLPEEQGFLRDIQGAACQQFNTVLAPGSNVYHYDHIHVDLMRRASGRVICQPAAISGEEVASRAAPQRHAGRNNEYTGSIGSAGQRRPTRQKIFGAAENDDWIEDESRIQYRRD